MNSSQTTNNKTLSLFDIVFNIGIGVNVEGLARVTPSSFSGMEWCKKNIHLMKVKPSYKLPSFRLGIMEVVTAVAHAAVASLTVTLKSSVKFLKKNLLLNDQLICIAPGRTDAFEVSFNTASSQSAGIGRMVYDSLQVNKHFQFFLNTGSFKMTTLSAAGL